MNGSFYGGGTRWNWHPDSREAFFPWSVPIFQTACVPVFSHELSVALDLATGRECPSWLTLFTEGDKLYDTMLSDIHAADSAIRINSYISAEDATIERKKALAAASDELTSGAPVWVNIESKIDQIAAPCWMTVGYR